MFTIREEQCEALQESAFINYLLKTFRKRWQEKCRQLGQDGLTLRIKNCLVRAEDHGITEANNKTRFINLGFLLEDDKFDTAKETPWAQTILGWESGSEALKMSAMEKRAEMEIEKRLEAEIRNRQA